MDSTLPDPPRGQSDAFEQAWLKYGQLLVDLHRLSDVSLASLDMLARLHDELARFDEQIDSDGLMVTNSQGRSANPLLQYRARCNAQILQLIKSMGLEAKDVRRGFRITRRCEAG